MTLENKEGRQDGAFEACNAEATAHKASEQLNVFDKGPHGRTRCRQHHARHRARRLRVQAQGHAQDRGGRPGDHRGPSRRRRGRARRRLASPSFASGLGIYQEGPGARPRCERRRFRREHHHRGHQPHGAAAWHAAQDRRRCAVGAVAAGQGVPQEVRHLPPGR